MDRLDAMGVFVTVAEAGSLAAAARKLGLSPASVTRAVALLEAGAGERLLHRSTRALQLTSRGERQLVVYRGVLADLAEADRCDARIEGRLSLSAPELFGQMVVMPVVESFLDMHPDVTARVLLLNRQVALVQEGVDVAIRLAPLPDSELVAIGLGAMRRLLCAAPSYLERAGRPKAPDDLPKHRCIGTREGAEREIWHFTDRTAERHRPITQAILPRLMLNSVSAAIDSAIRGGGICRVMAYQVAGSVASGRLVPLLTEWEPAPMPIHMIFQPMSRRPTAQRAFVDHATDRLRHAIADISIAVARFGSPAQHQDRHPMSRAVCQPTTARD